jgi:hypothetical protein
MSVLLGLLTASTVFTPLRLEVEGRIDKIVCVWKEELHR